jgi:hypothetical protein
MFRPLTHSAVRAITLAGALAVCLLGPVLPSHADHGTTPTVDSIDGTGTGIFNGTLTNTTDEVDWFTFAVTAPANSATISLTSALFNPHLFLYRAPGVPAAGDLRASYTFIAQDDDSGVGLNSLLNLNNLAVGNYVIAAENFLTVGTQDPYTLTVSGQNIGAIGAAAVPEFGTVASLGGLLGLSALGIVRSRRRKA